MGSVVVTIGGGTLDPRLTLLETPSFVIADQGIRHQLQASYHNPFDWIAIGEPYPVNEYSFELITGPAGLILTPTGLLQWLPGTELLGESRTISFNITVSRESVLQFEESKMLTFQVIKTLPTLAEITPIIASEREPYGGWSHAIFTGYTPTDGDRAMFRWSLIGAPAGVWIDDTGGLRWPDDRGYSKSTPYQFTIRVDYETLEGWVSDETLYTRRVLPEPAELNFQDFKTYSATQAYGMLGYSIDSVDGWVVAGEPFPGSVWSGSGNPNIGRVRLWTFDGSWEQEWGYLQPQSGLAGQAFGASIKLAAATEQNPLRLAVGAPEAARINSNGSTLGRVGYVYVYAYDSDQQQWSEEARLNPPASESNQYFGGWVDIDATTLIASIEGADSAGTNTGALAIFDYDTDDGWQLSQELVAPDANFGDYFSYPADIDGDWIAAAANEDDDGANNAGAVHLFHRSNGTFEHIQKIQAPTPSANALFGERLLLQGDWLFVSAFREQENTGTVYVYQLSAGTWTYHETLTAPFITEGSAFGFALSIYDTTLTISAPGHLAAEASGGAWDGITLFELKDGNWQWSRQTTESPDGTPGNSIWGFSLHQYDAQTTLASIPDYEAQVGSQSAPFAGRVFMHQWNPPLTDPFQEILDQVSSNLGATVTAGDDTDQNGIPNLIEWTMGQDIASSNDFWRGNWAQARWSFIQLDASGKGYRFMIPEIEQGLGYRPVIEYSFDLKTWVEAETARWEPKQAVTFKGDDGSYYLTHFHPVYIDELQSQPTVMFRLKLNEIE